MRLEELVERASKYDDILAKDIKDYVHGRKYGLVYEASKPEFVRMYKKPVVRGDIVNILPPRGVMKDTKNNDDQAEIIYKVLGISSGTAKLRNEQTDEIVMASVNDIVALARFDKPIYAGLKETGRVERGGDKPYHLVINGENYHALQTLVYAYPGQVDCIYIDPPYNSGAKDWKYNNNYVSEQDIYRHSKWLTFMEDRLKLAKKLLNPKNSVLIVTIDEKEYLRLGLLLEQLFPPSEGISIQMVSSVISSQASTREGNFSRCDEFLYFVFLGAAKPTKSEDDMLNEGLSATKSQLWFQFVRTGKGNLRVDSKNMFYPIFIDEKAGIIKSIGDPLSLDVNKDTVAVPNGLSVIWPISADGREARWRTGVEVARNRLKQGLLRLGKTSKKDNGWSVLTVNRGTEERIVKGEVVIVGKTEQGSAILKEVDGNQLRVPKTVWNRVSHNAGWHGSKLLSHLLPGREFPYPKSLYAVEDALRVVSLNKEALIVDFFSGSGTTAHAVMRLNHQDGGCRRCISITNNEVSADEIKSLTKKKLRQGDEEWEKNGIAQYITIPRIMAAITGYDSNGNALTGNYGIETERYCEDEDIVVMSRKTQKEIKNRHVYVKKKIQDPSVPDPFPMANGFEENALFFELEYLEPSVISADLAFDSIAPILWMCGGSNGEILKREKGYVIGKTYAILFETRYTKKFIEEVNNKEKVKVVFIVTDVAERYRSLCMELRDCKVMQLYESYLRSFEINAIG